MEINFQEANSKQLFLPRAGSTDSKDNKENERPPTADRKRVKKSDEDSDVELDLRNDQKSTRNVFLQLLNEPKENEAGKTPNELLFLNGIIDLAKKTTEFLDFCKQFTAKNCNRVEVPNLVCQDGAPINLDTKSEDLERTYAIDTVIYIFNRIFRMHQDVLEWRWIEIQTPYTQTQKFDGIKVPKIKKNDKFIMILEFSKGRKASDNKEIEDQIKLGTNAKKLLDKLSEAIPCNKLKVYTVQCINRVIRIRFMMKPLPSVYVSEEFGSIKILITFNDMEQFSKDMLILMNFQADILSAIQDLNRAQGKTVYNILVDASNIHEIL
ncbi:hypothetical protein F8M41_022049 [Gigaspora margarita]|uniref:Uncharacterized protein n=1 Tax=Gigaspora margarita TaxID=4874 RepID=A0A8H4AFP5_GIGMA|nr:hypothetical protein F8M41_022049 [Gigaspora margarita]